MEHHHCKVDFHMHSTVSDGTDSPAELLALVRAAGINVFSVTDHDAITAAGILPALRQPDDPIFVPGVEFSCKDEQGKYHILGYGYDPDSPAMRALLEHGHALRLQKFRTRLDFVRERFGFRFSDEETARLLALENPGKPHLAKLMVLHGYASSISEAIRNYIDQLRVPNAYVRPEEAIAGILGAGGVPVLAHPCSGAGDDLILGDRLQERIDRLVGFGLKGLEVYYFGYSPKMRAQLLDAVERHGLYATTGSDYHGETKPLIALGDTGLDEDAVWPEALRRFVREVCLA